MKGAGFAPANDHQSAASEGRAVSKHKYEIEAGAIFATLANNVNVGIGLTFYVWDKGRKKAAFCKYLSQSSEKEGDRHARAIIDGTAELSHRGIGAAHCSR